MIKAPLLAAAIAVFASMLTTAQAQTATWDGDVNGNWNTDANWVGDAAPTAGASLTFQGTANPNTVNDIADGFLVGGIMLANTNHGENFTLGGANGIVLSGSLDVGINANVAFGTDVVVEDTINLDIDVDGPQQFWARANTDHGAGSNEYHHLTINGAISGDKVRKRGGGTLTVNVANSHGGFDVDIGILALGHSEALGTSNALVNTGATLQLGDGITVTNDLLVSNTGGNKIIQVENATSNTAEYAGNITVEETGGYNLDINAGDGAGAVNDRVLTISGRLTSTAGAGADFRGGGVIQLSNPSNDITGNIRVTNQGTKLRVFDSGALGTSATNLVLLNSNYTWLELGDGVSVNEATALVMMDASQNRGLRMHDAQNGVAESAAFHGDIESRDTEYWEQRFDVPDKEDTLTLTGVLSGTANNQGFSSSGNGTVVLDLAGPSTFTRFRVGDGHASTYDGSSGAKEGFVVVHRSDVFGTGYTEANGGQIQAAVAGINIPNPVGINSGDLRLGGANGIEFSGDVAFHNSGVRGIGHYSLAGVTHEVSGDLTISAPGDSFLLWGSNGKGNGTLLFSGDISGDGLIELDASFDGGTVIFTGTNTYTGLTKVEWGNPSTILQIGDGGTSGTLGSGAVSLYNRARLAFNRSDTVVVTNTIATGDANASMRIQQMGTGKTILTGDTSGYAGMLDVDAGILQVGDGGPHVTFGSGAIDIDTGGTLALNRSDGGTIANDIDFGHNGGNSTLHAMAGTWDIDLVAGMDIRNVTTLAIDAGAVMNINTNASSDNIGVDGDVTLRLIGDGDGTMNRYIASGSGLAAVIKEGSGTWTLNKAYDGSNGWTVGGLTVSGGTILAGVDNCIPYGVYGGGGLSRCHVTVAADGKIDLNDKSVSVNSVSGSGSITNGGSGAATLVLGAGDVDGTIAGVTLDDGSGTLAITKTGSGSVTIASDVTATGVSGATTVSAGGLTLDTAVGGIVTVADGAALGGKGSAVGAVSIGSATGAVLTVDASIPGAFTAGGNLGLSVGTHTVVLRAASTNDAIAFPILNYGTLNGGVGNLQLLNAANYRSANFSDDGLGTISLNVGSRTHTWDNDSGNRQWDIGASANWDSPDDRYYDGDYVTFGGSNPGDVRLMSDVNPSMVTFNNPLGDDYTLADNDGGQTLSAWKGIQITGAGDVTISNAIAGATRIDHTGSGTLTLDATNTFTGGTVVRSGSTLFIENPGNSGNGVFDPCLGATSQSTVLTVESGGTLHLAANVYLKDYGPGSIKLEGAGVGGNGALRNTGAQSKCFMDELDFTGDITINLSGRLDIDGRVYTSGETNITVTKNGNSVLQASWDISSASIGEVIINTGDIVFEGTALNGDVLFTVHPGADIGQWVNVGGTSTRSGDVDLLGGRMIGTGSTAVRNIWTGDIRVLADGSKMDPNASDTLAMEIAGTLSGTNLLEIGNGVVELSGDTSGFTGRMSLVETNGVLAMAGNDHMIASLWAVAGAFVENGRSAPGTLTLGGDNSDANLPCVFRDGAGGGAFGLVKVGSGTVTLSATSSYSGATGVEGGTLLVTSDSTNMTGTVTVQSGAMFGGAGSVGGGIVLSSGAGLSVELNDTDVTIDCAALTLDELDLADCEISVAPGHGVSGQYVLVNAATPVTGGVVEAPVPISAGAQGQLVVSGNQLILQSLPASTLLIVR